MIYKGYTGHVVDVDEETGMIFGKVVDIRDGITFQAPTGLGLLREFRESVDVYLEWAAEDGFSPEKPHSGKLKTLTPPFPRRGTVRKASEAVVVPAQPNKESQPGRASKTVEVARPPRKPRVTSKTRKPSGSPR